MTDSAIQYEVSERGVASLCINRPDKHNAFDDVLIASLIEQLKVAREDSNVRVLVLKSSGKSFSAGADLNWMRRMSDYSYQQNRDDSLQLAALMSDLNHFPKPTIAAVQGAAFGGGVGLVACCDIAIAMRTALFSLSEVRLGLIPAVISPYVVSAIGARASRRYFLTAESFNAEQAHTLGLVHELVEDEESLKTAITDMVGQLLAGGPAAQTEAKKLVAAVDNKQCDKALEDWTAAQIAQVRSGDEAKEGLNAFLNKRKPGWTEG